MDIKRAVEMLRVAAEYIDKNDPGGVIKYDGAGLTGGDMAKHEAEWEWAWGDLFKSGVRADADEVLTILNNHARLVEALRATTEKLKEYAVQDDIAIGYGAGCFSRPDEFVGPTVLESEALLAELDKGDE